MALSFLYWAFCRLLEFVILTFRLEGAMLRISPKERGFQALSQLPLRTRLLASSPFQ
jgi:hypothetical protein